jgi:hypothetical protein
MEFKLSEQDQLLGGAVEDFAQREKAPRKELIKLDHIPADVIEKAEEEMNALYEQFRHSQKTKLKDWTCIWHRMPRVT